MPFIAVLKFLRGFTDGRETVRTLCNPRETQAENSPNEYTNPSKRSSCFRHLLVIGRGTLDISPGN